MKTPLELARTADVPALVFETFLQALDSAHLPAELIAQLHRTLLEEKTFTERALKGAILTEDSLP